jgi:hypothetical protein
LLLRASRAKPCELHHGCGQRPRVARIIFSGALEVVAAAVAKPTIVVNQLFSLHMKVAFPNTKVVLLQNKVALSRIKVTC